VAGVSNVEATAPSTLAGKLRARRAAMAVGEVAAVALGLFDQRGADDATVGEIATGRPIRTVRRRSGRLLYLPVSFSA
jgi:hypothetical protein